MSLNIKTLTQALAKTAAVIEKTVSMTVQEVTGTKTLHDYDLLESVEPGRLSLAWRLYSAKPGPGDPPPISSPPSGAYPAYGWVGLQPR